MRKSGRRAIPLTDEQRKAVAEYFESELTYKELADKYGYNVNSLKYWVAKYRKEQRNNGEESNN